MLEKSSIDLSDPAILLVRVQDTFIHVRGTYTYRQGCWSASKYFYFFGVPKYRFCLPYSFVSDIVTRNRAIALVSR